MEREAKGGRWRWQLPANSLQVVTSKPLVPMRRCCGLEVLYWKLRNVGLPLGAAGHKQFQGRPVLEAMCCIESRAIVSKSNQRYVSDPLNRVRAVCPTARARVLNQPF